MKDFELVVSLSKKEYIRATFIMLTKVRIIRILPVVFMIPIIVKIVADFMNDSVTILTYLIPLLPILIILILIYRVAQKSYVQNKDQLDHKKFVFSQDRLRIEVAEFSSEFPKSKLHKLTESKDFLFIWTTKNSAQVIPKGQIVDQEILNVRAFCQ